MAALNLALTNVSPSYPVPTVGDFFTFSFVFSVSDSSGAPVTGLKQTEIALALVGPSSQFPIQIDLSGQQEQLDANGDPVLDENNQPVMIPAPGSVPGSGLPGCYQQQCFLRSSVIGGRVVVQLAVNAAAGMGQTLAPFEIALPR